MRWFSGQHSRLGSIVAAAVFVIDQLHKTWMIHVYDIGARQRVVVTPFLDLVYLINPGVSYSLLEMNSRFGQFLLSLFALLVSLAITIWMARTNSRVTAIGLALVMGGALSNAFDRPLLGGVADFFSLHAFGFRWYVFNLADVAIVAGVILLVYESLLGNGVPRADSADRSVDRRHSVEGRS